METREDIDPDLVLSKLGIVQPVSLSNFIDNDRNIKDLQHAIDMEADIRTIDYEATWVIGELKTLKNEAQQQEEYWEVLVDTLMPYVIAGLDEKDYTEVLEEHFLRRVTNGKP